MGCNHDCASCSSDCSGKESVKEELRLQNAPEMMLDFAF